MRSKSKVLLSLPEDPKISWEDKEFLDAKKAVRAKILDSLRIPKDCLRAGRPYLQLMPGWVWYVSKRWPKWLKGSE